jgi:hypothetical protein
MRVVYRQCPWQGTRQPHAPPRKARPGWAPETPQPTAGSPAVACGLPSLRSPEPEAAEAGS